MDGNNPWQVVSIEAFYCLKCPECMYFTTDDNQFYNHAVENHPLSGVLFGKPKDETVDPEEILNLLVKNEPPDYEDEDDETLSEKTFETIAENSKGKIESGSTKSYEPFSCKFCLESFSDLNNMKMHLKIHDKAVLRYVSRKRHKQFFTLKPSILNETPFQNVSFDSVKKEETSDQMSDQSDLGNGPDELNEVKEEWPQKVKKSLECTFCKVHFQRFSLLRQHIVSVHGKKPHKCEKCEYSFAKMCDLKHHTTTVHEGKKPHKCCYCESSFSTNYGLKRHTATVHDKENSFKCDDCELSFAEKCKLENHIQVVHYGNFGCQYKKMCS